MLDFDEINNSDMFSIWLLFKKGHAYLNAILFEYFYFRFELKSSPFGATLDSERGVLKWKAISNLIVDNNNNNNKLTEVFVVKAVGGCGEQTFFEVNLDVLRCDCLNGGHCRTDLMTHDSRSPVCQCPKGFTGDFEMTFELQSTRSYNETKIKV
jgi:hypothetical protein